MKDKSIFIKIADMLLLGLAIYLISYINNIYATIIITFFFVNIIIIIDQILETKLFNKENRLFIIIDEIKKMNDKTEKTVNIITFFYPSIFAAILAVIIHLLYIFIK